MEDLPLGRIAALVPEFAVKDLPLGRTMMMMMAINLEFLGQFEAKGYKSEITWNEIKASLTSIMGGSPGDVSEEPVMQEKRKKGWRMSCGVGEVTEGLENEL